MLKFILMIIRYSPFFLMSYQDFKKVLNYIKSLLIDVKSSFLNWNDLVNSVNENLMMDYIILQTTFKSVFFYCEVVEWSKAG